MIRRGFWKYFKGGTGLILSIFVFVLPGYSQLQKGSRSYSTKSVLADGTWYKIQIDKSGVYRLSFEDLTAIGLENPSDVRVYGNGGQQLPFDSRGEHFDDLNENPIYMDKGSDAVFNAGDFILFYGIGPVTWKYDDDREMFTHQLHQYSDHAYYFISDDLGAGKRIQLASNPPSLPEVTINQYDAYAFKEKDSLNLIKSGRQWCWSHFSVYLMWGYDFSFPNHIQDEPVKVLSSLWSRSTNKSDNSRFQLLYEDQSFETVELPGVNTDNYEALYASTGVSESSFTPSDDNFRINIQYIQSNPAAEGWLDYLTLNTRCDLRFTDGQLPFRDITSVEPGQTGKFMIQGATEGEQVWMINKPGEVYRMETSIEGSSLVFNASTSELKEYVVFRPASNLIPVPAYSGEGLGEIPKQNLHGSSTPDMVIVVHDDLKEYAKEVGDLHLAQDGLESLLVSPEQIYNEFSSGNPDVTAIRDFLKMFFDRADGAKMKLKYLLLFGDGSYDNKDLYKEFPACLPTYQSHESLYPTSSYLSDDFFGLLDDGEQMEPGILDIGIGRLPVLTDFDAAVVVDKIKQYTSTQSFGDWRSLICFIGDDEDGNGHMRDANTLADLLIDRYPAFNIDKIFLDAYQQVTLPAGDRYPEVNRAINDRIRKGALIMNYLGHGSERGLAHEEILTTSDIQGWTNYDMLPLFMTATCEFSRYDDIELESAGEAVLLNPNGGGIALLTTTRLVYSSPNFRLNREFYDYVFEVDENGKRYTLGDIIRLTKNSVGSELNKLSFALLGDPALTLNFPENQIVMTEINNTPVNNYADTLKALSEANIKGYVADLKGTKLESFNGYVAPTVFDKERELTNLGNDGGTLMEFSVRNNILFKGKASVTGGEFNFSFIVPKDIAYQVGKGKFSFYASDNLTDAFGVNLDVLIGGSNDSLFSDNNGPEIGLFMNDTTFVSGGITNGNPTLLARLYDEFGINTVGNGIGHDITAILDGNQQDVIVLNDYYESDMDKYNSGMIRYPLNKISPGEHTVQLKVWDILNNSSEAEIQFVVNDAEEIVIEHVLNYPNPFTTHTDFYFEHNQGHLSLDVLLQVFTVSGKLVKSFEFLSADQNQVNPGSFRVGPIPWDGLDDFGDRIGRGTYFYRVKIRTPDGKSQEAYQKLVILR